MTSIDSTRVETEGKPFSNGFQPTKERSIRNLQAAIDSFCESRNFTREFLAEDLCGMSPANFHKVSHGMQGDWLLLVTEKLPGDIREDFEDRERKDRTHNPMIAAAEAMVQAAFTIMRLSSVRAQMAHAEIELPEIRKRA